MRSAAFEGASQRVRLKPFIFLADKHPLEMTSTEKNVPKQQRKTSPSKKVSNTPKEPVIVELLLEEPKVRYLKLQPHHRERRIDFHTCKVWKVPDLRLCGNWLEAAGFYPEEYVSVTVAKGVMIIRPKEVCKEKQNQQLC